MYTSEIIFLVEESIDGGYEARALGQSIYTEGETLDELKKMVADAVRCHFEEGAEHLQMSKDELIRTLWE